MARLQLQPDRRIVLDLGFIQLVPSLSFCFATPAKARYLHNLM